MQYPRREERRTDVRFEPLDLSSLELHSLVLDDLRVGTETVVVAATESALVARGLIQIQATFEFETLRFVLRPIVLEETLSDSMKGWGKRP